MDEGKNLINVCYESQSGTCEIRTCYLDGILHFSLKDIFITLNKENREMGEENPTRFIPNLIKAQIKDLDQDEYTQLPSIAKSFDGEMEIFVTQPGLNRVMGNDKSKAGRKFQRWLYHEVVPSLTKFGVYPPPITPQGSALSQMAEILAQNSRALADAINRQDRIEQKVDAVKGEMKSVTNRLNKLENNFPDSEFILSVSEWFEQKELILTKDKEKEIIAWCENISLRDSKPRHVCPSGVRENAKFYSDVIAEAKSLVERSKG